jgi:hypothetical protein
MVARSRATSAEDVKKLKLMCEYHSDYQGQQRKCQSIIPSLDGKSRLLTGEGGGG